MLAEGGSRLNKTSIEWAKGAGGQGFTWNPVKGCSMAPGSEAGGCLQCYACRMAARGLPKMRFSDGSPLAHTTASGPRWTGRVELNEIKLDEPLRRRKPAVIFVNSMSDLYHEKLPDEVIDRVQATIALAWWHKYISLTKRAKRQREYWTTKGRPARIAEAVIATAVSLGLKTTGICGPAAVAEGVAGGWKLPHAHQILGVSVEDHDHLYRLDYLRDTPAACRMLSAEPLLGDLGEISHRLVGIDWVVGGFESGPGARPGNPEWARKLRDDCVSAGVPFLWKQNGEWAPAIAGVWFSPLEGGPQFQTRAGGKDTHDFGNGYGAVRIGKKAAGRLLDDKVWDQLPEVLR